DLDAILRADLAHDAAAHEEDRHLDVGLDVCGLADGEDRLAADGALEDAIDAHGVLEDEVSGARRSPAQEAVELAGVEQVLLHRAWGSPGARGFAVDLVGGR